MSDDLKDYIYNNLDQKDTDELVEIWEKNDRSEWSDETFDVLEQILRRRLIYLPEQNDPIFEVTQDATQEECDEEISSIVLDDENSPTFYDPQEVLLLSKWLYRFAIVNIVIAVVLAWCYSQNQDNPITAQLINRNFPMFFFVTFPPIIIISLAAFGAFIEYLALKGLGIILKIIMEMEFNSRGVNLRQIDNDIDATMLRRDE